MDESPTEEERRAALENRVAAALTGAGGGRTEWRLQVQEDDGGWSLALHAHGPLRNEAQAVRELDGARLRHPEWSYRIASRPLPEFEPVDEAALRATAEPELLRRAAEDRFLRGEDVKAMRAEAAKMLADADLAEREATP